MVTRTYRVRGFSFGNELYHYGILGQKWGVRRFQNPDGTLTSAGKERYKDGSESSKKLDLKSVLAKEKEYRSEKHSSNKEAVKKYYSDIKGGKPEYLAKEDYKKLRKKIDNDLKEKYPDQARRREIAKNIAKGVGIAAVVGVSAYLVADSASYVKAIGVQADVVDKFRSGKDRAASIIASAMDKDISILSDSDEVVTANTVLQRVIRDYGDTNKALGMEKAKDFIYATFDKNDNYIYQTLFNARGEGKKLITERTVVNDLVMPSARKRASAFMELLKNDDFVKALSDDTRKGTWIPYSRLRHMPPGKLFDYFNRYAGNSESKSAPIYFKKIADMGYNAIRDDNDSGYLGKQPIILLNASKDTVQSGHKTANSLSGMMARLKMSNVPKYKHETIFA